MTLLLMFLYMMFSDLIASPDVKYLVGFIVIAIVAINMFVSFGIILLNHVERVKKYVVRYQYRQKEKKNKKNKKSSVVA